MKKADQQHLSRTLELAGVSVALLSKIKILDFSRPDREQNKRVHSTTNELILDLLRTGDLEPCIHITGEMRALTDPFHRRICEEIRLRGKGGFDVLFNVPEERRQNATSLVAWNLSRWARGKSRNWEEELRTIDVIAGRAVNLFAYDTLRGIQYSVFGHRHVLLQEQHRDTGESKRVWLLESEKLNAMLLEHALSLKSAATDIDEGLFHEFALNVSGVAARRYLRRLQGATVEREALLDDVFIRDYVADPSGPLNALIVMGFVAEADRADLLKITPAGLVFLGTQ